MERSIIYIENIWVEDLFNWFYTHVCDSGGDGAAVIVCKNYKEVSEWFVEWWLKEHASKHNFYKRYYEKGAFCYDKDEYKNIINYHDDNESFMFTDDINIDMFSYEYIFVVKKDCIFENNNKRVLAV